MSDNNDDPKASAENTDKTDAADVSNDSYRRPDADAPGEAIADAPESDAAESYVADDDSEVDQEVEQPQQLQELAEQPVPAPATASTPSRLPAALALLFALGALGLSGYLFYELRYQDPLALTEARLSSRIDELAGRAQSNSGELTTQSQALRTEIEHAMTTQTEAADALRNELAEQQENLEAAQAALAESLGETIAATPPTDRDWKLAEAQYLLRIANHRLLMERDAATAAVLLGAADQVLAEVGDFSLFDVRSRLADEILSLKSLTGTDLQGMYLQLEALKNSLQALPLQLPEYMQAKIAPQQSLEDALGEPTEAQNIWGEMGSRLSVFFDYRKIDGQETRRPLLSPAEATYLEMNLRLMLERSQLALLRRNQMVYEQSLSTAADWMEDYLDAEHSAVAQAQQQIEQLLQVELQQPLPDISGSLSALNNITRGTN
jgi:uroporphyrin-3 C-methyltransferase